MCRITQYHAVQQVTVSLTRHHQWDRCKKQTPPRESRACLAIESTLAAHEMVLTVKGGLTAGGVSYG